MNCTRMTAMMRREFELARKKAAAAAGPFDQFLSACPICGSEHLDVVSLVCVDGRRRGRWPLEPDGFAWGAASNGDGSTEQEIVQCQGCKLVRPLSDFTL